MRRWAKGNIFTAEAEAHEENRKFRRANIIRALNTRKAEKEAEALAGLVDGSNQTASSLRGIKRKMDQRHDNSQHSATKSELESIREKMKAQLDAMDDILKDKEEDE